MNIYVRNMNIYDQIPANTKHLCYVYKIFNPISVKYY